MRIWFYFHTFQRGMVGDSTTLVYTMADFGIYDVLRKSIQDKKIQVPQTIVVPKMISEH